MTEVEEPESPVPSAAPLSSTSSTSSSIPSPFPSTTSTFSSTPSTLSPQISHLRQIFLATLPLLAAEIFSCIQSSYIGIDFIMSNARAGIVFVSMEHTILLSGILVPIIVGIVLDRALIIRRRIFMIIAFICYLIALPLILSFDKKASTTSFQNSSEKQFWPWLGCIIPGYLLSQSAISILQLCGRSLLIEQFPNYVQLEVHALATTFQCGISFLFKFIFYFIARSGSTPWAYKSGCAFSIIFAIFGFAIIALGIYFLTQDIAGAWQVDRDWKAIITDTETFPQFFHIILPAAASYLCVHVLELWWPISFLELPDASQTRPHSSYALGFLGFALMELIAGASAWLGDSRLRCPGFPLGPRAAMVCGLFFSGFCLTFAIYCRVKGGMVFLGILSGVGIGVSSAVPWGLLGQLVPKASMNKFVGLYLAGLAASRPISILLTLLTAILFSITGGSSVLMSGLFILVILAGFLSFLIPVPDQQPSLKEPLINNKESLINDKESVPYT